MITEAAFILHRKPKRKVFATGCHPVLSMKKVANVYFQLQLIPKNKERLCINEKTDSDSAAEHPVPLMILILLFH